MLMLNSSTRETHRAVLSEHSWQPRSSPLLYQQ